MSDERTPVPLIGSLIIAAFGLVAYVMAAIGLSFFGIQLPLM
jgi:hypothetical protein